AAAYAALLMAHLPSALLASVTVLPLYVLFRSWRLADRRAAIGYLLRCACAALLGIGLAAPYLLPATRLQPWISADLLWFDHYRVDKWFVAWPASWLEPHLMKTLAALAIGYALAAAAVGLVVLQRRVEKRQEPETAFWAATAVLCLLLLSGV